MAAVTVVLLTLAGLAAPQAVAATTAKTTLATGVTYWRDTFRTASGRIARSVLLHVDLRVKGLTLDPATDGQRVGSLHRPVSYLADQSHAVAGINADFFDWASTTPPQGAFVRAGRLMKSPRSGHEANFFVRADGTAGIGQVPFTGLVTRPAVGSRPATSVRLFSINTLADARKGRITLATSDINEIQLPAGCTTATGTMSLGHRTVVSVQTGQRQLARRASGTWALIACGGTAARWLKSSLAAKDPIVVSAALTPSRARSVVSGGGVLVARGVAHSDPSRVGVRGRNPETFACTSRDGRSVLLGVVDGRSTRSAGVSYADLTAYLLRLHCYSGMVFDGGGSSTLVARLPRHTRTSVLNVPSDGHPRAVPDGLFVYKR